MAFRCPAQGTTTTTIIEGAATPHKITWNGADADNPALCDDTADGLDHKVLYGLNPIPTGSGASEMLAAYNQVFAGDPAKKCFQFSGAKRFMNDLPAVYDDCIQQLGTSTLTVNGQAKRVMVLRETRTGTGNNYYAGTYDFYLDLDTSVWIKMVSTPIRGAPVASWTRTIDS